MIEQQKGFDFDPSEHHRADNLDTSVAAAHAMNPVNAAAIMGMILGALRARGPATQAELAATLGLRDAQVWKRISDLKNKSHIEPSGITRPGPSGREQTVWRVKSAGA
jgi:predicted ArsR family transcriptional regulator